MEKNVDICTLIKDCKSTSTLKELGDKHSVSMNTIRRRIKKYGIKRKNILPLERKDINHKNVIKKYMDGIPSSNIGDFYGCPALTILNILRKYNIKIRNGKGKNHWNWKNGRTSLKESIRNLVNHKQWRTKVFERDDYKCWFCSKKGYIEAHHLKRLQKILTDNNIRTIYEAYNCEELWDITNGITLCSMCHNTTKKNGEDKMEILMNDEDIKRIIKKTFSGIKELTIEPKDFKVMLSVDFDKFSETKQQVTEVPPKPEPTIEEKNQTAKQKGLMASGGEQRLMQRF